MLLSWIAVFIVALIFLVKGADWLLQSSEKIGKAAGLSPFIVGVLIVGLGTSLPELASSIAAIIAGTTEIVVANAIGSNIANILLVVGLSAVVGKQLSVSKNLIDLDIPLLAIVSTIFISIAWDQQVVFGEALLLVLLFIIYVTYILTHTDEIREKVTEKRPKLVPKDFWLFILGAAALILGAKFLIDAVIAVSITLDIAVSVISLAAVAIGTSLPELIVSVKAAMSGKAEVALGNIFGSNVFNLLLVVGIPGLFVTLPLDEQTFKLGLPIMLAATFLFIISGISRKIHSYEGAMYLIFYLFFLGQLFGVI